MLYAFLLLGLLPLALFPDGTEHQEPDNDTDDTIADDVDTGVGDLLDEIDSDASEDDVADDGAPEDDEIDEVLQPSDDIDVPNVDQDDPEHILPPVIEDDVATSSDGDEGDVLDPVDEPDIAAAGPTIDTGEIASKRVAEIDEFDVNVDVLCVYLDEQDEADEDSLSLKTTNGGEDSEVYFEEKLIAILRGVDATVQPEINIVSGRLAS